jgi:hypothetical protein
MVRKLVIALCLFFACLAPVLAGSNDNSFKVMTQNMDTGTDLGYALYGLQQPDPRPYIDLTYAEVQASLIPQRALALAAEIAASGPHMVALQEVTLWRTGPTPATANTVLYDQLDLLMKALNNLGARYKVVAVNTLTDVALPMTVGALRLTDRDVMIARSDLRPWDFAIVDAHTFTYKALIKIGDITVRRGYTAALAWVNGRFVKIMNTHLETPYPGIPAAALIQKLQAAELVLAAKLSLTPVVLAGDYNADAIAGVSGPGPDNTDTVAFIEVAGYADSWAAVNPNDPGATWPLYSEDEASPPPFFVPETPFERIDLIFFGRGLKALDSVRIGAGLTYPAAASDHTGVMTTFGFGW